MVGIGDRVRPSLLARDLNETTRFYVDRLGFRVTGRFPGDDKATSVELSRDGVVLAFYSDPPSGTPTAPVMSGTLYLYPDDVTALAEVWGPNVHFEWGPEVMDYGFREFAIRDPNGYLLAFAEPV